mmetsp:Transcript_43249/g.53120  ORF Transcript_43249/g.53120 Transcript_43249/m.53120 type:complete len:224 (-) Transcript_43249:614-1285(-)
MNDIKFVAKFFAVLGSKYFCKSFTIASLVEPNIVCSRFAFLTALSTASSGISSSNSSSDKSSYTLVSGTSLDIMCKKTGLNCFSSSLLLLFALLASFFCLLTAILTILFWSILALLFAISFTKLVKYSLPFPSLLSSLILLFFLAVFGLETFDELFPSLLSIIYVTNPVAKSPATSTSIYFFKSVINASRLDWNIECSRFALLTALSTTSSGMSSISSSSLKS